MFERTPKIPLDKEMGVTMVKQENIVVIFLSQFFEYSLWIHTSGIYQKSHLPKQSPFSRFSLT